MWEQSPHAHGPNRSISPKETRTGEHIARSSCWRRGLGAFVDRGAPDAPLTIHRGIRAEGDDAMVRGGRSAADRYENCVPEVFKEKGLLQIDTVRNGARLNTSTVVASSRSLPSRGLTLPPNHVSRVWHLGPCNYSQISPFVAGEPVLPWRDQLRGGRPVLRVRACVMVRGRERLAPGGKLRAYVRQRTRSGERGRVWVSV